MKTRSARTRRFANLFALAAAFTALCPGITLAENGGSGGPSLPQPIMLTFASGTTITASSATTQPDGSTTYNNVTVTWSSRVSKSAAWANVSTSGAILFSDGTTGHI